MYNSYKLPIQQKRGSVSIYGKKKEITRGELMPLNSTAANTE
jgi:hypothetical protein